MYVFAAASFGRVDITEVEDGQESAEQSGVGGFVVMEANNLQYSHLIVCSGAVSNAPQRVKLSTLASSD